MDGMGFGNMGGGRMGGGVLTKYTWNYLAAGLSHRLIVFGYFILKESPSFHVFQEWIISVE